MNLGTLPALRISAPIRHAACAGWLIAVGTVIFLSLSKDYGPPDARHLDKVCHMIAYGVLAALPFTAFMARRTVLWAALAMLPLGIVLEGLQAFIPGRDTDPVDAVFNALGITIGLILGPFLRGWANRYFADRSTGMQ